MKTQLHAVDLGGVWASESTAALKHVGAGADGRGMRICRCNLSAKLPQPPHDGREVDRGWRIEHDAKFS